MADRNPLQALTAQWMQDIMAPFEAAGQVDARRYRVFQYVGAGPEVLKPVHLVLRDVVETPDYTCLYGPETFEACLRFVRENQPKPATPPPDTSTSSQADEPA